MDLKNGDRRHTAADGAKYNFDLRIGDEIMATLAATGHRLSWTVVAISKHFFIAEAKAKGGIIREAFPKMDYQNAFDPANIKLIRRAAK